MERLANDGDGNYFYIDSLKESRRIFIDKLSSTLEVIAKDVKIQVEWNKDAVIAYRLIGYENRDVADRDFRNDAVDAGEIGAGHQVTALYEVALADNPQGSLGTVRIRNKAPGPEAPAVERAYTLPVGAMNSSFAASSDQYRIHGRERRLRRDPARKPSHERDHAALRRRHRSPPPSGSSTTRTRSWSGSSSEPRSSRASARWWRGNPPPPPPHHQRARPQQGRAHSTPVIRIIPAERHTSSNHPLCSRAGPWDTTHAGGSHAHGPASPGSPACAAPAALRLRHRPRGPAPPSTSQRAPRTTPAAPSMGAPCPRPRASLASTGPSSPSRSAASPRIKAAATPRRWRAPAPAPTVSGSRPPASPTAGRCATSIPTSAACEPTRTLPRPGSPRPRDGAPAGRQPALWGPGSCDRVAGPRSASRWWCARLASGCQRHRSRH